MKFKKATEIVERRIRDERILVPIAASEEALDSLFTLNETAGFIWDCAVAGHSPEQIAAELAEAYDVPPEKAFADTGKVLASLQEAGVLEAVGE